MNIHRCHSIARLTSILGLVVIHTINLKRLRWTGLMTCSPASLMPTDPVAPPRIYWASPTKFLMDVNLHPTLNRTRVGNGVSLMEENRHVPFEMFGSGVVKEMGWNHRLSVHGGRRFNHETRSPTDRQSEHNSKCFKERWWAHVLLQAFDENISFEFSTRWTGSFSWEWFILHHRPIKIILETVLVSDKLSRSWLSTRMFTEQDHILVTGNIGIIA